MASLAKELDVVIQQVEKRQAELIQLVERLVRFATPAPQLEIREMRKDLSLNFCGKEVFRSISGRFIQGTRMS